METFTTATLQQKNPLELLKMRKRVISELRSMADSAEGRNLTANEKALEERGENNLDVLDKALEAVLREQAFDRYSTPLQ
jgi:hypothetical protein